MVTEERAKELEALDRRINFRRKATTVFFVLLSVVLVIYAVKIERKIHRLSQSEAVVVYKESAVDGTYSPEAQMSTSVVEEVESVNGTDNRTESDDITEKYSESDAENVSEASKNGNSYSEVYYITLYGTKYHKSGCSYLPDSKKSVTQEEIISGGYTPCSRCIK